MGQVELIAACAMWCEAKRLEPIRPYGDIDDAMMTMAVLDYAKLEHRGFANLNTNQRRRIAGLAV